MWTWKNWLGYTGIAVGVVLISFIVEWHIRTGWQMHWADGLIRWWADFVMFGWVHEYQTFLAGFLAVGGGAFAMVAVVYQRQTTRLDRNRDDHASAIATLNVARGHYQRLIRNGINKRVAHMEVDCDALQKLLPSITRISPNLADWLQRIQIEIENDIEFLQQNLAYADGLRMEEAVGNAVIAKCYLTEADRLLVAGKFSHSERALDLASIKDLRTVMRSLPSLPLAKGRVYTGD